MQAPRRLPAPWRVLEHDESFEIKAANDQSLAFVYFEDVEQRRNAMQRLTRDEARRVAANIAKLPELLGWSEEPKV